MEWTDKWPEEPGKYWILQKRDRDGTDKWRLDVMTVGLCNSASGGKVPYRTAFGCIMFPSEWKNTQFLFAPVDLPTLPDGVEIII